MLNTSFFFPILVVTDAHDLVELVYADQLIKKLTEELRTSGTADIQITWKEDISLEKHLQESIKANKNFWISEKADKNFWMSDNTRPNGGYENMVIYKHHDLHPPYSSHPSIPGHWPPSISAVTKYWKTRSKWTIGFACKKEFTARSILKRWMSDAPLSNISSESLDIARCTIINAMKKKLQESEKWKCPGLHAIPDEEWQKLESKHPSADDCAES